MNERVPDVIRVATELFEQTPDWVVFFREVLGINGIVRQVYPTAEERAAFERTEEYGQLKRMLADLRRQADDRDQGRETQRVITVRMPESLHETLKAEAAEHNISINQLCISKLVRLIDAQADLPHSGKRPARDRKKVELEVDL